jgi:hypothetical protein
MLRLDVAVAEPGLDRLACVFEQHGGDPLNARPRNYYGIPAHPRIPEPTHWLVGGR